MIEHLRHALERVEELSPELQEELALQIEEMMEPGEQPADGQALASDEHLSRRVRMALAAIGSWGALRDDDEFEALDHIRHDSQPTPPVEDELGEL